MAIWNPGSSIFHRAETGAAPGAGDPGRAAPPRRRPSAWMANGLRWLAIALCLLARPAFAQWTVAQLDDLAQAFATGMATRYKVEAYPWYFMTDCNLSHCQDNNPDTIYGSPNFSPNPGEVVRDRRLASTSAMVFVMETPPPMRYFGVTAYMGTKYYDRLPGRPSKSGRVPVSESLTDTVNLDVVGTTGAQVPGSNVFTQLAVFVVTADAHTYDDVCAQFVALGYPRSAINQLALPISVQPPVPLNMGLVANSDTYATLMRLTYPQDQHAQDDYVQRSPIRSFYMEPKVSLMTPVPPTVYRTPGTGVKEPAELQVAQGQLVKLLLAQFAGQYANVTEFRPIVAQTVNYANIAKGRAGLVDNPDGLYMEDAGIAGRLALALDDRILVVGVNHDTSSSGTGKATYFSHSLEVLDSRSGVIAVADAWLDNTGLVAAGITDPHDPRYATYSHLYAFSLSYNCPPGDALCIMIPQGDRGAPVGTPLLLLGRIYLDPATKTRPSNDEIIVERVFVMSK